MLRVTSQDVVCEPFPHVIAEPFLDPGLYARLHSDFPRDELFEREVSVGGRSGRDIYRGDNQMRELLHDSAAWREFHEFINSKTFLKTTLEFFGEYFEQFGCKVSPTTARFENYAEPRTALVTKTRLGRVLSWVKEGLSGADPDQIYSRLDIHQGAVSYGKSIHCDRPNRLVSMIIYFCDADEIACQGGELSIHAHKSVKHPSQYERYPRPADTRVVATVKPRHNLGIFFLCCNNSYHSVARITAQKKHRDFVYINLSSRAPKIW